MILRNPNLIGKKRNFESENNDKDENDLNKNPFKINVLFK